MADLRIDVGDVTLHGDWVEENPETRGSTAARPSGSCGTEAGPDVALSAPRDSDRPNE